MPYRLNGNALERYTDAQSLVIKRGMAAPAAIKTLRISDDDDKRLLRHLAATRDTAKGMPAPQAVKRNEVDNEADQIDIKMSAAKSALRKKVSVGEAVAIHGITNDNHIKTLRLAALQQEMVQGKSAIEAAAIHKLPTNDYIFRVSALIGAELDVERKRSAEEALARNGVDNETDALKIFTKSLQQRKSTYVDAWLKGMRKEQVADFERAKAHKTTRKRTFQPTEFEPVADYVDLEKIGAQKLMDQGKAAPEILTALNLSEQSHIAEIKSRCARRDFEGSCDRGPLGGKAVSALYALKRNQVYDRDVSEQLFREEVQRSAAQKARDWASSRALKHGSPAVSSTPPDKRRSPEPVQAVKRLRSTAPTDATQLGAAMLDKAERRLPQHRETSVSDTREPADGQTKLDTRYRGQSHVRSS